MLKLRENALPLKKYFLSSSSAVSRRKKQLARKKFCGGCAAKNIAEFMGDFPFTATNAQHKAIETILNDMRSGHPMSRLLEGDVGSAAKQPLQQLPPMPQ